MQRVVGVVSVKQADARRVLKVFLESTPPNVPVKIPALFVQNTRAANQPWYFTPGEIELFYDRDGGQRWFGTDSGDIYVDNRDYEFLTYKCKNCTRATTTFAVVVERNGEDAELMKLGQFLKDQADLKKAAARLGQPRSY